MSIKYLHASRFSYWVFKICMAGTSIPGGSSVWNSRVPKPIISQLTDVYIHHRLVLHTNTDGLVQERHSSIANALELRFSCTNPSTHSAQKNDCRYTEHSRYIVVIFLRRCHEWHPIAHPWERGMGCRSWMQNLPEIYHCNCCSVCTIMLFMTVIYQEFFRDTKLFTSLWVPGTTGHDPYGSLSTGIGFHHWCFCSWEILRYIPRTQEVNSWWVFLSFDEYMTQDVAISESLVFSVQFLCQPVTPRPVTLLSGLQLHKRVGPAGRQHLYLLCWAEWSTIFNGYWHNKIIFHKIYIKSWSKPTPQETCTLISWDVKIVLVNPIKGIQLP